MKTHQLLLLFLTIGCLAGCAPSKVQTPKISTVDKTVLYVADQAKIEKAYGPITLSYRKLGLAEIAEHLDMDEETAVKHLKATNIHGYFSLSAKNYPPGTEFTLYHIDVSGNVKPGKTFFVNGNGTLITPLDDIFVNLENNFLFFSNYLPGEPVVFVFGSADRNYYAATRIIPNPIETGDDQGRKISVQLESKDGRHYFVHCSGCVPYASYILIARFENEKLAYTVQANAEGHIFQSTAPTAPWVKGGEGSVELQGENISKPLAVAFHWGS